MGSLTVAHGVAVGCDGRCVRRRPDVAIHQHKGTQDMKVVFFEDVEGTAQVGEIKEVKNGFARNYLLPRNLAGPTSKDNLFRAQTIAQREARRQEKLDAEARTVTGRLDGVRIEV